MTGTFEQRGKLKFATKLLPNRFWGVRYVVEMFGGPDRDRTDDLFHAIVPTVGFSTTYKTPVAP